MDDLSQIVETQRAQMRELREKIAAERDALADKLNLFNREVAAIDSYLNEGTRPAALPVPAAQRRTGGRRQSSKRDEIRALIAKHPDGLTRGDILETLGAKGDKSAEMSVSNALTAMKAANVIKSEGGKWFAAQAA